MRAGVEVFALSGTSAKQVEHAADLNPPFTRQQLDAMPESVVRIQCAQRLKPAEWRAVADWLQTHPQVEFRMWTAFGKAPYGDLAFLQELPAIEALGIDLIDLRSFEGLNYMAPSLKSLSLGQTRSRAPTLGVLARFPKLEELDLDGHRQGIDVLSQLTRLKRLRLRRITLVDGRILLPLKRLREFGLILGGTTDVSWLPQVGKLKRLELSHVRGLTDLASLTDLERLEQLHLESLAHVASLPSLAKLAKLRKVFIQNLSRLEDLSPLAAAPNLRALTLYDMPQLAPETFASFVGHSHLKRLHTMLGKGLRESRLDRAVQEILPFATS